MFNVKSAVYTALTVSAITTYTSNINYFYPESFTNMPCISYKRIENVPSLQYDNSEQGATIYFQIDIWSNGSTTLIEKAVDIAMKDIDFDRAGGVSEDYDEKQKIYKTSIRYKFDYAEE